MLFNLNGNASLEELVIETAVKIGSALFQRAGDKAANESEVASLNNARVSLYNFLTSIHAFLFSDIRFNSVYMSSESKGHEMLTRSFQVVEQLDAYVLARSDQELPEDCDIFIFYLANRNDQMLCLHLWFNLLSTSISDPAAINKALGPLFDAAAAGRLPQFLRPNGDGLALSIRTATEQIVRGEEVATSALFLQRLLIQHGMSVEPFY